MTPAGIPENVEEFVAPAGSPPGVAEQVEPFVEGKADGIIAVDVPGEPEANGIGGVFGFKGAEELVPNDQRATMIAIDVTWIRTVMYAMVRRRVEDRFQGAERANQFGVNPELIKQADRFHGQDHHRSEAYDGQPQPEQEAHESAGPGLTQCGRKVITLRGMMHHVRGPEEAALVAHSMEPVIAELVAEEEQNPRPPLVPDVKDGEAREPCEDGELHDLAEQIRSDAAEAHGDAGRGIFQFIDFALQDGADNGFEHHERDEGGDGELDQVLHGLGAQLFYNGKGAPDPVATEPLAGNVRGRQAGEPV